MMLENEPHMKARLLNAHLAQFDISKTRGYLPDRDPPRSWTDLLFPMSDELKILAENLPKYLAAGCARKKVEQFSELYKKEMSREEEKVFLGRLGSQMLDAVMRAVAFIAHVYVFGSVGDSPTNRLPEGIARLLYFLSQKLGRPPVLSYKSYALDNWYRIDRNGPITVDNLALIQNTGGGVDEEWFTTIHVDIEQKAGRIPNCILDTLKAIVENPVDSERVLANLMSIYDALCHVNATMRRMPERCDPYIYYNRVRPYIHGWKRNRGLPKGVFYEGVEELKGVSQTGYYGETGAQSSIFPALYAFFGVQFKEDVYLKYLHEMREYMPPGHKAFICFVESFEKTGVSAIQFAKNHKTDSHRFRMTCRACILQMIEFLTVHYGYASSYIEKQAQKSLANDNTVGTGGSIFMELLTEHIILLDKFVDEI